jgi:uncharacterized membrane protein required for colicin V production
MLAIQTVFWMFVFLFGIVGVMRGWAKEIVATAGMVLALFALETFGDPIQRLLAAQQTGSQRFYIQTVLFLLFVFAAYQGPALVRLASRGSTTARPREGVRDGILGLLVGMINGYLVAGTIWFYLHQQGYPFAANIMMPPAATSPASELVAWLPPAVLKPYLPPVMIVLFVFVLVAMV